MLNCKGRQRTNKHAPCPCTEPRQNRMLGIGIKCFLSLGKGLPAHLVAAHLGLGRGVGESSLDPVHTHRNSTLKLLRNTIQKMDAPSFKPKLRAAKEAPVRILHAWRRDELPWCAELDILTNYPQFLIHYPGKHNKSDSYLYFQVSYPCPAAPRYKHVPDTKIKPYLTTTRSGANALRGLAKDCT